jgi:hypothetical protein
MRARSKRLGSHSKNGKHNAMMQMFHAERGGKRHAYLQAHPPALTSPSRSPMHPRKPTKRALHTPASGINRGISISSPIIHIGASYIPSISSLYKLNRQDFVATQARVYMLCFRGGNNALKPSLTHVISSAGGSHTKADGACGCYSLPMGKSI